jgi:hypothetical protein
MEVIQHRKDLLLLFIISDLIIKIITNASIKGILGEGVFSGWSVFI